MRVVIVSDLPEDRRLPLGGVKAVAANLIEALLAQGVDVSAIGWGAGDGEAFDDERLGCRVHPVPIGTPGFLANWGSTARRVQEILSELQPDVAHFICIPELGWYADCPRVFALHGIPHRDEWLYGRARRFVTAPIAMLTFRASLRRFRHMIVHNPGEVELLRPPRHLECIEIDNPVEDDFFEIEREPFSPRVLYIARLSSLKNTLGVVEAAARVRESVPDVRFRIVGDWSFRDHPSYRQRVEQLCADEGLQDNVEFVGALDRAGIRAELASAACLLLPSFQEMAPAVIGEAMAAGVAVAASRISGIPYLVRENESALLFDPQHSDEIAASVVSLLTDHTLRQRIAEQGRAEASRFRGEAVARRHLEAYAGIRADYAGQADRADEGQRSDS
jgi:glycosyltransferase involved in cell wall biosynthesis